MKNTLETIPGLDEGALPVRDTFIADLTQKPAQDR